MVCQLLIPRFTVNVRDASRLDTLTRGVIVHVLESILVEVDRRWAESLRGRLVARATKGKCPNSSAPKTLVETNSDFLRRQ